MMSCLKAARFACWLGMEVAKGTDFGTAKQSSFTSQVQNTTVQSIRYPLVLTHTQAIKRAAKAQCVKMTLQSRPTQLNMNWCFCG